MHGRTHILSLCLIAVILAAGYSPAGCQTTPDSLPQKELIPLDTFVASGFADSLTIQEEWAPDPKKALLMSLALPGLGQIYNHSWWKTPLIYGGLGVSVWFIKTNHQNYLDFRKAYSESFDPETENELVHRYPNQETLRRIRDIYYKRYQLSIIATAGVYLINGLEAYVDAHLKNFNVSDDLSFILGPSTEYQTLNYYALNTGYYPIIGFRYHFR